MSETMNIDEFPEFERSDTNLGNIEIRRPRRNSQTIRSALFDFDGTLSLIRRGWQKIMLEMMLDTIRQAGDRLEDRRQLEPQVKGFIDQLTGKQTIYQMIRLAEEVERRNGEALDPLEYKQLYNQRLLKVVAVRRQKILEGKADPEEWMMPNSLELLRRLKARGVELYLASGTDVQDVLEEADLLGLTPFFGERIYGAVERPEDFSKSQVIRRILEENQLQGDEFVSFGDGYVEILNTRQAGGLAIGVASDERTGLRVDSWKRNRLIQAGADVIIPGYSQLGDLMTYLFREDAHENGLS